MTRELPDVQANFRKGRGTRDQIANIRWIMGKRREAKSKGEKERYKLLNAEFQRIARRDALNMPANLENSAVATGLEKVSFHSNLKERQSQRMLKLPHNYTHLTC